MPSMQPGIGACTGCPGAAAKHRPVFGQVGVSRAAQVGSRGQSATTRTPRRHRKRHTREANAFLAMHALDRKSTRLNSSHANISYAVFCLKKKTQTTITKPIN